VKYLALLLSLPLFFAERGLAQSTSVDPSLDAFVKSFKGRGEFGDGSKPSSVDDALKRFQIAPGLKLDVVAHEPDILKPIEARFDERGRLWVVQYLQFPFPAGLKVVKYDEYLRAVYDKVPEPPPRGVKGRDRITILEDRDGDGIFETKKDFLTDLNMATSVLPGRGGVWVMNSPYLLFYPDKNHDDIPDGDPEVRLSGFGMEDTHALANGLRWGPDGWLYGCTGSTITSTVRGIHWLGQAVWRYQPETDRFEIFCEGGGNTWAIEFDSQGRMFTGTNYSFRGLHLVQGGSYLKSFAKHGPLMNPYSFGYFEHMRDTQSETFTHVNQPFLIYEGGAFPARFDHHVISGIPLSNRVQSSALRPLGSTFETLSDESLVATDDRWFRPVSISAGPDGGVYFSDWYDARLTNLDPRDTWDHQHGRIYRLRATDAKPAAPFDLAKLPANQLIEALHSPNKWWRETAIRVFYDQHDTSLVPRLHGLLAESRGQFAIECLWALNACGGFDEQVAREGLEHPDEFVRSWRPKSLPCTCGPNSPAP
jgi:putative membrane-bound dehydrogenase-like protein